MECFVKIVIGVSKMTSELDRLLELERKRMMPCNCGSRICNGLLQLTTEEETELQSLKSQIESDLNEYKKIKKVFIECDLITESGNIFIPDLKGLREGHMVVVDREEYEELKSKLAEYEKLKNYGVIFDQKKNGDTLESLDDFVKRYGKLESQHTNLVKAIQELIDRRERYALPVFASELQSLLKESNNGNT